MKSGFDNDSIDLERLVRLVMTDLGVTGETPASQGAAMSSAPSASPSALSAVSSSPSVSPARNPSDENQEEADAVVRLTAHVITMDQVRNTAGNRQVRRILVPTGAVVTPSAKDEMKKRRLELVYDGPSAALSASPTQGGPISLSASNVPFSAAASTLTTMSASSFSAARFSAASLSAGRSSTSAASSAAAGNLVLAFHALPLDTVPKNFLDTLQKSQSVTLFRSDCVLETADRLSEALVKPENRGILLTGYSAVASAVCNRRVPLRGLVGYDLPQMEADAALLGANLLILDPARLGFFRLRQMIARFAAMGAAACPSVIRKGLEP